MTLESKQQRAELLLPAHRPTDALQRLDEIATLTVAKHGNDSAMYGKLQSARARALNALARNTEARTARTEAAATAAK